jgi:hypothetical protein
VWVVGNTYFSVFLRKTAALSVFGIIYTDIGKILQIIQKQAQSLTRGRL